MMFGLLLFIIARSHRRSGSLTPAVYRASFDSKKSVSYLDGDDLSDSFGGLTSDDTRVPQSSSFSQETIFPYDSLRNFKNLTLPRAKSFVDPPPLLTYSAIMGRD